MPISDNDSISEHSDSDGSDTVIRSGTSAKSPKVKATQRRPTKNTSKPTGASKAKTKNKKISAPAGREQLVKHLLQNMNAGRQDALDWLKESLSDAIEDFEDGNNEGIPLVPIMDYSQEAMENSEFQEMLKAFGICEPFDEQEVYWRIPGHLTVDILSSFCSLIQEALENTLTGSSETNDSGNGPENSIMNISNHAEDVELETNEETENEDLPRGSNTNDAVAEDEEERSKAVAKKSRFRATIDSDSDDENKAEESNSKRLRSLSDSDTETPVKKRNRIIDSDED